MAFDAVAVPIDGGLNLADAPGWLQAGEARRLRNMVVAGARLESRRSAALIASVTGDPVGVFRFPFYSGPNPIGAIALVHNGTTLELQRLAPDGAVVGSPISGWTGVAQRPRLVSAGTLAARLFMGGRAGSSNLTLRYFDAASETLITPEFQFSQAGPAAPMTVRAVAEYNNLLFVAGYGTEADPDRPEFVRFSYLGLFDDGQGAGDAGSGAGHPNLFDVDDGFMVGERGTPVRIMHPAGGRLVILTARELYHLFGHDRSSFALEALDNDGGTVAGPVACFAQGTLFWWHERRGPLVYTGNGATELGARIRPVFGDVDLTTLVAVHSQTHRQVRWYWADGSRSRYVAWNYERERWEDGTAPFRIFGTGRIASTSTNVSTGGETDPPSGPAGPPTGFIVIAVTSSTGKVGWTAGDASAQTEVLLGGQLVATLDPGIVEHTFGGLQPSTTYQVGLRHRKNGITSSTLSGSFTTSASSSQLAKPENPAAFASNYPNPGVSTQWDLGQTGVRTQVERRLPPEVLWDQVATTGIDATSYYDPYGTENHVYRFRHEDANDSSRVSAYTSEIIVII